MSDNLNKINIYKKLKGKNSSQPQSGLFQKEQLLDIMNSDNFLVGNNVVITCQEIDLPNNDTKYVYTLEGNVRFEWESVVRETSEDRKFKKMFRELKNEIVVEIKKESNSLRKEFKKDIKDMGDSLRKEFKQEIKTEMNSFKQEIIEHISNEFQKHIDEYHK